MSTMGYVATLSGAEETAALSLDFEKNTYKVKGVNKAFNELFTTVRPTRAGRVNEKGLYELVEANQPRFDYDPITKVLKGLLVEEARTNLLTYSSRFDNASVWGKACSNATASPTTAPNYAVSPDGTLTAVRVMLTLPGDGDWALVRCNTTLSALKHSSSIWLKAANVGQVGKKVSIGVYDVGLDVFQAAAVTLTADWLRFSVSGVLANTSGSREFFFGKHSASVSGGISNAEAATDFLAWGSALEASSFPTSYIPSVDTFTSRASTATYFDKEGVLGTAGVNVARADAYQYLDGTLYPVGLLAEAATTNLLLKVTTNGPWDVLSGISYQNDTKRFIDGITLFRKLVEGRATGAKTAQTVPVAYTAGSTYTFSCYAKEVGRRIHIGLPGGVTGTFNLLDGSSVGNGDGIGRSFNLGNGIWRVSLTFTPTESTLGNRIVIRLANDANSINYLGDGESGIYIGGMQMEEKDYPTSYIPSTDTFQSRSTTATYFDSNKKLVTASINEARSSAYDWTDKGEWKPLGLLSEASATNLALQSNSDTTFPSVVGTTYVDVGQLFVDGLTPLRKIVETNTNATHRAIANSGVIPANSVYTVSFIVKPDGRTKVRMLMTGGNMNYDLVAMTAERQLAGAAVSGSVQRYGNGFFRITRTARVGATDQPGGASLYLLDDTGADTYQGDGVSGMLAGGFQVEVGAQATSYIPTTTAQATRAADGVTSAQTTRAADIIASAAATRGVETITMNSISSWYNQPEGTMATEFTPGFVGVGGSNVPFRLKSAGLANDHFSMARSSDTSMTAQVSNSSGTQQFGTPYSTPVPTGVRIKAALAIKLNSAVFSPNGNIQTDTTLNMPSPDRLELGTNGAGSTCLNGHLHKLAYYPVRVSNSQAPLLSS